MATPVKVRRLSDEEGRQLQRIVRRGGGRTDKSIVKWRRALVVLRPLAGGNDVAAIARLVQSSSRPLRRTSSIPSLAPRASGPHLDGAGGRHRRIRPNHRQLIRNTATKGSLTQASPPPAAARSSPGTRRPRRERGQHLRCGSARSSPGPDHLPAHQDLEGVTHPLRSRSCSASSTCSNTSASAPLPSMFSVTCDQARGRVCWAEISRPQRLRANYHKPHGTRQLFAGSVGADRLMAASNPRRVPARPRALKAIRACLPDGQMVDVILTTMNHYKGPMIREWCADNAVEWPSHPPMARGPTRSGPTSDRCVSSPLPIRTTRATPEVAKAIRVNDRLRNADTTPPPGPRSLSESTGP